MSSLTDWIDTSTQSGAVVIAGIWAFRQRRLETENRNRTRVNAEFSIVTYTDMAIVTVSYTNVGSVDVDITRIKVQLWVITAFTRELEIEAVPDGPDPADVVAHPLGDCTLKSAESQSYQFNFPYPLDPPPRVISGRLTWAVGDTARVTTASAKA